MNVLYKNKFSRYLLKVNIYIFYFDINIIFLKILAMYNFFLSVLVTVHDIPRLVEENLGKWFNIDTTRSIIYFFHYPPITL
jgi:hypothetical protein